MKLLILTDGISPLVIGGMQKHSFYLAKNLALLGHKITLVHCIHGSNALPSKDQLNEIFGEEASQNLEIITLRFPPSSWYPGHYLKESYIYSRNIFDKLKSRLNEFDFIYAKGFTAWHFLEKKEKGEKMPPVGVKFHGYEMFQKPANFKMRMQNWLLSSPTKWNNLHADFVFSYGGKITEIIRSLGVKYEHIIEIPTGIEMNWCRSSLSVSYGEKIKFAFIGRFERRKGVEELNAALNSIEDSIEFEFHFIGPIPNASKIRSKKIIYHGSIAEKTEIQHILDVCQVLVVPSHSEGMPNVIMEGMARGLAILATDVGAVKSVVDEENGWFITPGNHEDLKNRLLSIMKTDAQTIRKKQEKSLSRVKNFSWDHIASTTAKRIEEKLN